jgi:hypothetical protein
MHIILFENVRNQIDGFAVKDLREPLRPFDGHFPRAAFEPLYLALRRPDKLS